MITSTMVAAVDVVVSLLLTMHFFGGMRRTRVDDRDQAHHSSDGLWGGSGLGVRRCGGMGTCGNEG